jgi:hypothetical protein
MCKASEAATAEDLYDKYSNRAEQAVRGIDCEFSFGQHFTVPMSLPVLPRPFSAQ